MEIEQDVAKKYFLHGGTFICLDLPVGSEFGIDMKFYTTGEKFNGVKMIPPGVHFIYFSVSNSWGGQSPRIGFFHHFKEKEVVVKKWDTAKEDFLNEDSEVCERVRVNLKTMDKFLGAYPFEVYDKWKKLSNKISKTLVDKMVPFCGKIYSAPELRVKELSKDEQSSSKELHKRQKCKLFLCDEKNEDFLPILIPSEGTEFRFSKIPDKCYPENSTPSQITKHSLDSTYVFEQILAQHNHFSDILGEIQLAFVCFLIGCSFEAFEHWKKLIGILCSCDEALSKHTEVFNEFIPTLNYQLQEVQEDFLVDIVASNNFIYKVLKIFFRNLKSNDVNGRLKARGERFQNLLTEKFSWDFSDIFEDDEDELPVIVEL